MVKAVSYIKFASVLNDMRSAMSAAETQGMLTGMLSLADPKQGEASWRSLLLESLDCQKPSKKEWDVISKLATQLQKCLQDESLSYNLLLPDDEQPLKDRLEALGAWCRGYLSGLGLIGLKARDLQNAVVKEIIEDIGQIARISLETNSSEEDESNYAELVEFLRIAVQNVCIELRGSELKKMLH